MRRVVLDTSVLVAGIRSRRGASFQIIQRVGLGVFEIALSVPLVLEYEDAMLRHAGAAGLTNSDVRDILDYLCSVGVRQEIFYLWRPALRDPGDDLVLELAVAAECDAIITHNLRDFRGVDRFGLNVWSPGAFLDQVRSS